MAVHACNLKTGRWMDIRGHWRSLTSLTGLQAPDPGRAPVSRTKVGTGQLVQHLRVFGALAHAWWFTTIHKHSSRASNRHAHGTHTGRQAKHTHKVKLKKKKNQAGWFPRNYIKVDFWLPPSSPASYSTCTYLPKSNKCPDRTKTYTEVFLYCNYPKLKDDPNVH